MKTPHKKITTNTLIRRCSLHFIIISWSLEMLQMQRDTAEEQSCWNSQTMVRYDCMKWWKQSCCFERLQDDQILRSWSRKMTPPVETLWLEVTDGALDLRSANILKMNEVYMYFVFFFLFYISHVNSDRCVFSVTMGNGCLQNAYF